MDTDSELHLLVNYIRLYPCYPRFVHGCIRRVFVAVALFVCGCAAEEKPSLLLISLDTVRADRLGSYGSSQGLTPNLDALARESVRFDDVTCQVPLTTPSHASILTGLLPQRHGIRNNESYRLEDSIPTLAENLQKDGYRTAAFISAFPLHSQFGFSRGFDVYDEGFLERRGVEERIAEDVLEPAFQFMRECRQSGKRFFALVHLFDAHSPYEAPEPFRQKYRDDPYGGEIAYLDATLGRFFSEMRTEGLLDETLVSVVSDHGEALGDHGENTHGALVYQSTVGVVWILRMPDGRWQDRSVSAPVRTTDVAPTLLGLLGAPPLEDVDGMDLSPYLEHAAPFPDLPVYTESLYLHLLLGWAELRSVRKGPIKLIDGPVPELYDLSTDMGETENVFEDRPDESKALLEELDALRDAAASESQVISTDVAEKLSSLGYVAGTTEGSSDNVKDPKTNMPIWREIEAATSVMSGDRPRARRHAERALELDPGNGLALKLLGDIEFADGDYEAALETYRDSAESGFQHPDLDLATARAAARAGRPQEAHALLSTLPEDDDVRLETARTEVMLGRFADAKQRAESVLASRPQNVEALSILGQSLRGLDRAAEAETVLRRGLELEASDAWLHNELGSTLAVQGKTEDAQRSFRRAIDLDDTAVGPRFNLARLVDKDEGDKLLREVIRLRPDYAPARLELAKRMAEAGRVQEAFEHIQAALRARPDDPETVFVAARIAELMRRPSEAIAHYRRFLELSPPELLEPRRMAEERLKVLVGRTP
jgi:arylsulfatase A-like enzyme/tetratricopeptide (TPR) repeat protein